MSDDTSGFEFGQSEPLTTRLRNIIRGYPRDIGILKELIQNADDAGASQIEVIMDWRRHDGTRLPDSRMRLLMGPALLIVNNKRFSNDDLIGIRSIGEGSKLQNARKMGRFGVGFNTVYNVTDHPSFLTGDSIYCFDPHKNAVANESSHGKGWKLAGLWRSAPDWPAVFQPGGLSPGADAFVGTIFRLPLRPKGTNSKICMDAFEMEDFEKLVSLAQKSGSELLLFTKNVFELTIREIDVDGNERCRLQIGCTNADEVVQARTELLDAMQGDFEQLIDEWLETNDLLPGADYRQRFAIRGDARRTETWQVVSRLFRGESDSLLKAARKMADRGEKAIPWAGVAARLHEEPLTVQRCKGKLFCSLPLPMDVDLPIHVNGYFDVDSSRQKLTTKNSDGEISTTVRAEWNRVLLEQGVVRAWGRLLTTLAPESPNGFYEIWPVVSTPDTVLASTYSAVYKFTSVKKVIQARRGDSIALLSAKDIALPPASWRDELHELLIADNIPLPEPSLPAHVEEGYREIIQERTPKDIRERIRVEYDVDVAIAKAPRATLKNRQWLEILLRFCLSDGQNDIRGLPLALLCDGKLHTFGYTAPGLIFIATDEQRALFQQFPHWFLDAGFAKATEIAPISSAQLLKMQADGVVNNLEHILGKSASRSWDPASPTPPNADWLEQLFIYLAEHKLGEAELKTLGDVPFIPASDGDLHAPGTTLAPLLDRAVEGEEPLWAVLRAVSVPIVEPPPGLQDAFEELVQAHPKLFREVQGQTIIAHLHACRANLALSKSQAMTLLDFFAEQRGRYDDVTLQKLRELSLFPVATGLVTAVNGDLYLPTGFKPPSIGLKVHLLEHADRWQRLCGQLTIRPLDQRRYLEEIMLLEFDDLSDSDRWSAWRWIRKNFTGVLIGNDDEALRRLLADATLRAEDGDLYSVCGLHDPESSVIADVLGDAARYPDLSTVSDRDGWLEFFRMLGLVESPSPEALLEHIDRLVEEGLAAEPKLRRVWAHLLDSWDELSTKTIGVGRRAISFERALSTRAWFPARTQSTKPGLRVFESRLYRADELYDCEELVGSQSPIFAWAPNAKVLKALGVQRTPSLTMVLNHFDFILDLWEKSEPNTIDVQLFELVLVEIYDYIDKFKLESPFRTQALISRFRGYRLRACLWDDERHCFWCPAQVFTTQVPFFEPLRTSIPKWRTRWRTVFERFGGKTTPTSADFIDFLNELAALGSRLTGPQQEQALQVLGKLASDDALTVFPLLTRDGRLLMPGQLYWDDAPWLRDRLQNVDVAHDRVAHELLVKFRVRRISVCAQEELAGGESESLESATHALCENLCGRLREQGFLQGLRRLLRHDHGSSCNPSLRNIASLRVQLAARLETRVVLEDGASLGNQPVRSYFAEREGVLFVTGTSESRIIPHVARTIQRLLGESRLRDPSPLEHILACDLSEISEVLDEDRITDVRIEDVEISGAPPGEETSDEEGFLDDAVSSEDDSSVDSGDITENDDDVDEPPWQVIAGTIAETRMPAGGSSRVLGNGTGGSGARPTSPIASWGGGADDDGGSAEAFFAAETPEAERQSDAVLRRLLRSGRRDPNQLWSAGSADKPSLEPGIGRSTFQGVSTRGDFLGMAHDDEAEELAAEIRDKAIAFVMEEEQKSGRIPTRLSDGTTWKYDILSKTAATDEERHIEVKGTSRDWRERPVRMTQNQLDYAFSHREQAWLYVVERLAGNPKLYRIQDLAGQIRGFRVESTWASLAEGRLAPRTPIVGMRIYRHPSNELLGEILDVKGETAPRLKIKTPDGNEIRKVYNPGEHRLEVTNGDDET